MTSLGQTSPREAREAQATIVRDIATGQVIARTNYQFLMPGSREYWVRDAIGDHFLEVARWNARSHADEVSCEDTDEGRFYSIDGKPVAYVEGEYEPLWMHLSEAAE